MEPDRAPAESSPRPGTDAALAALRGTELLIESLPGAIVAWDVDGTVLAWNANAERLYGWTSGNVLGRHIGELLILPAELDAAYEIALGVEAGEIWTGDLTIVRADATPVRIHTALRPLRNERGEIVGSIGVADDVTDQRAIEDRAAELTNHLLMALAGGELGTWRRDLDTDEIVWDENMERLYGLEPGTYDGTVDGWYAMIHPDDRDATRSTIAAAVAAGSSYQLEYRVLHPDGSIRWLQGRAMVTQHSDGSVAGTIGCSGDVTDRKLVELENERRALEAERLLEAGRLQRRRLEFLSGLNDAAMAADDHQALMQAVTEAAVPTLGDWCSLHFFEGSTVAANPDIIFAHHDPERVEWLRDLLAHHPYDPDAPLGAAAAVREGVTQFIPLFSGEFRERVIDNAVRATPDQARAILDELMPTSLIAVPLVTKRGVIGAMQFVSAESGRVYDADDVALAETAAGRVAEALDAAWLRDQQRYVANVLQSALLPARLPEIDGAGIAVRYWAAGAASEVGGDFYDVFAIGPDRWAVVIGDVCGTGPEAAAVTALARHTIRAAATHGASPVEVLEWLNDAILASDSDRFCTVLYSTLERIDAESGHWRFTSVAGGHPLPFLARAGEAASPLGTAGTLLGVMPTVRLTPSVVELGPGDTVVLNTDGITDVPAPHGIDEAAMADIVTAATAVAGSAETVVEHLGSAVQQVLPIPDRDDDIALVVVRISGGDLVDLTSAGDVSVEELVAEREFEPEPQSVSAAREFVIASAARPPLDDLLRLAVSELATNAVIHARSSFRVRVVAAGAGVRIEVADRSERMPVRNHQPYDAVSGRGIGIVEHLSTSWGVTPTPDGKSIWFELQP